MHAMIGILKKDYSIPLSIWKQILAKVVHLSAKAYRSLKFGLLFTKIEELRTLQSSSKLPAWVGVDRA